MLSHPAFDISHLAGESAHVIDYDFTANYGPALAEAETGSGVASLVGFTDDYGPALKLQVGANPGATSLTGFTVSPSKVKAVIIDVEGFSCTGASPLWGIGLYNDTLTGYVELFRDNTGVALTSQISSSANRQMWKAAKGDHFPLKNARMGLMVDFTTGKSTGHMGYSMMQTTTNQPTAVGDLSFKLRSLTTASYQNFTTYWRRITATVIR
jgi:hypothetical protein